MPDEFPALALRISSVVWHDIPNPECLYNVASDRSRSGGDLNIQYLGSVAETSPHPRWGLFFETQVIHLLPRSCYG